MTQPTKREQLAAMPVEDFKVHLRTIAGDDPRQTMTGAARPQPSLVRNRKRAKSQLHQRKTRGGVPRS